MHRIDTEGAVANLNGSGKNGFKNRNLATGQKATVLDAAFLNATQEEVAAAITSAGGTLVKTVTNQLLDAVYRTRQLELLGHFLGQSGGSANELWGAATNLNDRTIFVGASGTIQTSDDFTQSTCIFTSRTPAGSYTGQWGGVALTDAGVAVAVGQNPNTNGMQRSTDSGNTWAAATTVPGSTPQQRAVAYSPSLNRFVSCGDSNSIRTSDDGGVTWVTRTAAAGTNGSSSLTSVVWTGTYFFIVGTIGNVQRSADGITWTSLGINTTARNHRACAWDPVSGILVIVTNSATNARVFITADQGTTFSAETVLDSSPVSFTGTSAMSAVCGYDRVFLCANISGQVASSHDGLTWTRQTRLWPDATAVRFAIAGRVLGLMGNGGKVWSSLLALR